MSHCEGKNKFNSQKQYFYNNYSRKSKLNEYMYYNYTVTQQTTMHPSSKHVKINMIISITVKNEASVKH